MESQSPFSPIVKKIAAEVASSSKRSSTRRTSTEICLEEWWILKPKSGKGLAVGGRTVEIKKYDIAKQQSHSASAKKRNALREFHSAEIVKRHGCTTIETSDGFIISLCGFINKSRSLQNGFSSEVCRDFVFGFPCNWEDYAESTGGESSQANLKDFTENLLPSALETCNDAQLHGLVLTLSDTEKDLLNEKAYDNLIETLSPQPIDVIESPPAYKSTRSQAGSSVISPDSQQGNVKKKRRR